jgi:hypothetical protein
MTRKLRTPSRIDTKKPSITEITRRNVIDFLIAASIDWAGRLNEEDFLSRLYDLESLPSEDHRFTSASGDIWQHRTRNRDWQADWVFYDGRFDLMRGSDNNFLRFLCETVHPVVRTDEDEARGIVEEYNKLLKADGWEIFESGSISDKPVFNARACNSRTEIFTEPTGWPLVDRQIAEARLRLRESHNEEQFQAVGVLCREALISLAQAVYDPARYPTLDGVKSSPTDGKRMLEAFIAVELTGTAQDEARGHARAALRLALALQHDRTADFRQAALCAEATAGVINVVGILSGQRIPHLPIE